jgi:cobalt-zinc-cadmium efflux system membrane fusion protein
MIRSRYGLLVLGGVLAAVAAGCHGEPAVDAKGTAPAPGEVWLTPSEVENAGIVVAPVEEQDVDNTILTAGKVAFDDTHVTHVFSPVAGRVTRIDATLGQHVRQGNILAVIESPDVGSASSDVGKAQADLIAAQHDFARQKELYAAHAASQRDYEQAEDTYRKAKAELDRALQKMQLFRAGSIDAVTQSYRVPAEIDGEVLMRAVNPGIEVQGQYSTGSAAELFTIGDIDRVWVLADVFQMDLARVQLGAPVAVTVVTYPGRVFWGTVDWVSGMMDPTTRTAKVRCTFDNADHALKPEMYVTVQITVDQKRVVAIPRSAFLRLGEQTVVFVERGSAPDGRVRYERVPVSVEDEGEGSNWLPVTHGVTKGTPIVTAGAILLAGMAS